MCLTLRKIKHSYKYETINGEQLIPVWKFITVNNNSPYSLLNHIYVPNYTWKKGWNKSDRDPDHKDLSLAEKSDERVSKGFHFFLNKKSAKSQMHTVRDFFGLIPHFKTVKMYVRKKDVIAKGINADFVQCLVATNAYWKG